MDDKQKLYVFSDYVCPWCYLGQSKLKKVLKKINLKTELIHFPLHPETPTKGMELTKLFNCTKKELIKKNIFMEQLMSEENLNFKPRSHTFNSRLAQELGYWAEKIKNNYDIHDKIYNAYFFEQKNLSDLRVLIDIASSVGLDIVEAEKILHERTFKDNINTHWKISFESNVSGVPTYSLNGRYLVGAQSEENLIKFIVSQLN